MHWHLITIPKNSGSCNHNLNAKKVRDEKRKNVHAFVIGNLEDFCEYPCPNIPDAPSDLIVTYNPYVNDSFVYKGTDEPVYHANMVDMVNGKNKLFVVRN